MRSIDGWATLIGQAAPDRGQLSIILILLGLVLVALGTLFILTFMRWIFRRWTDAWDKAQSRRDRAEDRRKEESPWQVAGRRAKPIDPGESGAGRGEDGSSNG